ncbi:MAG: hypothetical protein IKX14_07165, partial [Neisseriaceae bacterium]|nr:hypothetical protein [Neisseriaceae bacterium]
GNLLPTRLNTIFRLPENKKTVSLRDFFDSRRVGNLLPTRLNTIFRLPENKKTLYIFSKTSIIPSFQHLPRWRNW